MNNNNQLNKYLRIIGISLIAVVLLAGCAKSIDVPLDASEKIYGFWNGLWHGIISPVTFIVSLFKERVAIYAVNNNGGWYDFGFMLGISIIFGGPCGAARRKRRCRDHENC
jgi:predicted phage tail protein